MEIATNNILHIVVALSGKEKYCAVFCLSVSSPAFIPVKIGWIYIKCPKMSTTLSWMCAWKKTFHTRFAITIINYADPQSKPSIIKNVGILPVSIKLLNVSLENCWAFVGCGVCVCIGVYVFGCEVWEIAQLTHKHTHTVAIECVGAWLSKSSNRRRNVRHCIQKLKWIVIISSY